VTLEIAVVLLLLIAAVILFATERLPVDLVAGVLLVTLVLSGIVTPAEGLSGFSNTATATVAAMFVLSAGLVHTGAVRYISTFLTKIGRWNAWAGIAAMILLAGLVSAFVNNTPVVAILIPVALRMARESGLSPSKLLMPLSFASMFGGVCTLIGTSTNILVSSIAEQKGQPPFQMFEFTQMGLVFFAVGTLYLLLIGIRLIPDRGATEDLTQTYEMTDYLVEVVLLPESRAVGKQLIDAPFVKELDLDILEIVRDEKTRLIPFQNTVLKANDILRVRCSIEKIRHLQESHGLALRPEAKWRDQDLESDETILLEVVIAPNASLQGKSLEQVQFRNLFGATVLAVRHHEEVVHEQLSKVPLQAGDMLLVKVNKSEVARLREHRDFVFTSEVWHPSFRKDKIALALAITFGVVFVSAMGWQPIVVTAMIGALLMVLTGCLKPEEGYAALQWRVLFLLAGVLVLGTAMEKTGAADYLAGSVIRVLGPLGPYVVLSALYLLTSLLTEAMSNNATAVLLTPIALVAAESMGVNPRPFLMAVAFAASASFMTPVGYQTNTLIYAPGKYKFADFLRVGTPLNLLFWLLATFLIPIFWPFEGGK
jgi:di/tricarboxylate transporter